MNDAVIALTIDLTVFTLCAFFLLKLGRLTAMHPATTYLFFHLWVVTKRLVELSLGSPLSAMFPHQPISLAEITRASLMFDAVLVVMTAAWIITSVVDFKNNGPLPALGHEKAPNLSKTYVVGFAQLMIPLGIFGLIKSHGGGTGNADWDKSVASNLTGLFLPLSLMPFFYWYGPKKWVLAYAVFLDVLCELMMGQTRWLLLLPTIFCCYAYLSRTGRKWPPRKVVIFLAVLGLLWLPGKQINKIITYGGSATDVAQVVTTIWTNSATESNSPDTQFLDMAAMTVSLLDAKGDFYHGETIWPAVVNFVPRPLWPDKPVPYQWEHDISTVDRPMQTYGMTPSIMGAAYVDFGYTGIVVEPFLFALFLGWAYFKAFRSSYYSVGRFAYLVMACTLFQPLRDGIYSFFICNFAWMSPMVIVVLLHLILPTRPMRQRPRYPKPVWLQPAGADSPIQAPQPRSQ